MFIGNIKVNIDLFVMNDDIIGINIYFYFIYGMY